MRRAHAVLSPRANAGVAIVLGLVVIGVGSARGDSGGDSVHAVDIDRAAVTLGLEPRDVSTLTAGRAWAQQIETKNGSELAASGVVVVPRSYLDVTQGLCDLTLLVRAGLTSIARRLSPIARLADFEDLELPPVDVQSLREARPGRSSIKLSRAEIISLRSPPDDVTAAFKRSLLSRARAWQVDGVSGLGSYSDKNKAVGQASVAAGLINSLVKSRPAGDYDSIGSFEYWSIESFGDLKPLVTINHVSVYRHAGGIRLETVQVYASHYCEGLATAIDLIPLSSLDGEATLVRLTFRAQVDSFGGLLGGMKRRIGRARMAKGVAEGLERMRTAATLRP